ncbi:hypothetical protein [Methylobacterium sp. JK268]
MGAAVFSQVAGQPRLYVSADAASPRPFGFLASAMSGATATLADLWSLDPSGVFFNLSAPTAAANWPQIERNLRQWLAESPDPGGGLRLLWVDLADDGATPAAVIPLVASQPTAAGASLLTASLNLDFRGYGLDLPIGAGLAPTPTGDALEISGPSLFARSGSRPESYEVVRDVVTIPVAGARAGSLSFCLALVNDGTDGRPSDFRRLDIGVRYGWRADGVRVAFHTVPTLAQPAGTTWLWGVLAPFDRATPPLGRLSFLAPDSSAAPGPVLASSYVTCEGRAVMLTPIGTGDRAGGLVLARQPLSSSTVSDAPFTTYLTPDGDFAVTAGGGAAPAPRIVCGLGVMEHVTGAPADRLSFSLGPAFLDSPGAALSGLATTAYAVPGGSGGGGAVYCAQPEAAPFYGDATASGYLGLIDVPAAVIPAALAAIPMLGHAGLEDAAAMEAAVSVEQRILGPARAALLAAVPVAGPPQPLPEWGLTPQGLVVGFDPKSLGDWQWMGVANVEGTSRPDITFDRVGSPFRQAMQAAAPFVVLADPDIVLASATVPYRLSGPAVDALRASPPACFSGFAEWSALSALAGTTFPDEAAFDAAVEPLLGTGPEPLRDRLDLLRRLAGQMRVTLDDWRFDLAPRTWPPAPASETGDGQAETRHGLMIIKLDRTVALREWIDQLENSAWPAAAVLPGGTLNDTADVLRQVVATAQARYAASRDPANSPYAHFLGTVLIEPTWVGTLVLNAAVPLDALPDDLRVIRAGLKPELFYAHHIGFEPGLVGLDGDALALTPDRIFGVIDYEDTADLTADPGNPVDFQFKALHLTAGFARSRLTTFSSQVELCVGRLFDAVARKYPTQRGNNLILDGVKVMEAGDDGVLRVGYRFGTTQESDFQLAGCALALVSVTSTSLTLNDALSIGNVLVSDFTLAGAFQFQAATGFDMFSYGPAPAPAPAPPPAAAPPLWADTPFGPARVIGHVEDVRAARAAKEARRAADVTATDADVPVSALAYRGLVVRMTFDMNQPDPKPVFGAFSEDAAFDPAASTPRRDGLANRFPAVPARFLKGGASGQSPKDMGYVPVICEVQQASLSGPWYGLEYRLDLGTLGNLGGSAGIPVTLLAAWGIDPDAEVAPVFLGIKLPGAGASGYELALQGVLRLGFGAVQIDTYPASDGGVGYLMRLRDFGLHLIGQTFPSGHINVLITGAPGAGGPTKLGWFAGYAEDGGGPTGRAALRRRIRTPRRGL